MSQSAPQSGKTLSTSMFYMWRCVITIAHADGRIDAQERAYLNKVFAGMDRAYGLTPEQKKAFADDIDNPKDIAELLPYINDPAVRGQLIYFGGLMAMADGHKDPREDAILKKLRADQLASLDMEAIHAQVKTAVADEMFQHDLRMSAIRPQKGLSAILDRLLLRLGIDGLENYAGEG